MAPSTWSELQKCGLASPAALQALDDLEPGKLAIELKAFLGRAPAAQQFTEFCELVWQREALLGLREDLLWQRW